MQTVDAAGVVSTFGATYDFVKINFTTGIGGRQGKFADWPWHPWQSHFSVRVLASKEDGRGSFVAAEDRANKQPLVG